MGSKNRGKAKRKIAKLSYRIASVRNDVLHKLTTGLTRSYSVIVIGDPNVGGMMANGKLSKAIADMGFFEFGRQLGYKTVMTGGQVIVADRFFPSTKKCSGCGNISHEITLSDRVHSCPVCGLVIDRDYNAALNPKALAAQIPASAVSSVESQACGEDVRPKQLFRAASAKQESEDDQI